MADVWYFSPNFRFLHLILVSPNLFSLSILDLEQSLFSLSIFIARNEAVCYCCTFLTVVRRHLLLCRFVNSIFPRSASSGRPFLSYPPTFEEDNWHDCPSYLPPADDQNLDFSDLEALQSLRLERGSGKSGKRIVQIVGKYFPEN